MWTGKPAVFIRRDFRIWRSYGIFQFLSFFSIFFHVFVLFAVSRSFRMHSVRFPDIGHDYLPFFFIGIVLNGFWVFSLNSFSQKVVREQILGIFETLVSLPVNRGVMIVSLAAWDFLYGALRTGLYFAAGAFFFGFHAGFPQIASLAVMLCLGIVSFMPFGIISAACIVLFKRRDPFNIMVGIVSGFLSGVYVPLAGLPPWAQNISRFIPLTYLVRDIRLILLEGYVLPQFKEDICILGLFSILFFLLAAAFFDYAMKRGMKDGSLSHY